MSDYSVYLNFRIILPSSVLFQISPNQLRCSTFENLLRTGYILMFYIACLTVFTDKRQAF